MAKAAQILRIGLLSTVLIGVIFMSLSLKVRHFEGNDMLVAFEEFESKYINDNWLDLLLIQIAETGEDLPGKHLQLLKKEKFKQPFAYALEPDFIATPHETPYFSLQEPSYPAYFAFPPPNPFVPLYRLSLF